MSRIHMIDLVSQHQKINSDINSAIETVINSGHFIGGHFVRKFEADLAQYLGSKHVISCGNGTDALQVALMALDLKMGDEVIIPSFGYASAVEVTCLLGLRVVMVDIHEGSFNIDTAKIEETITENTKAIIVMHLFGQCADMPAIMTLAKKHNLHVIEDNAQSLGSQIKMHTGKFSKAGSIGHIGCTSFFPTKNLACLGDGGAVMTNNDDLAKKIRMICRHGQSKKYYHEILGINSRLDALQASILQVKLKYLEEYLEKKIKVAQKYSQELRTINQLTLPVIMNDVKHTFNQYSIKVDAKVRRKLQDFLMAKGIPTAIYYPLPLYEQPAFRKYSSVSMDHNICESTCDKILSLPIHTEMTNENINYICQTIKSFFA